MDSNTFSDSENEDLETVENSENSENLEWNINSKSYTSNDLEFFMKFRKYVRFQRPNLLDDKNAFSYFLLLFNLE